MGRIIWCSKEVKGLGAPKLGGSLSGVCLKGLLYNMFADKPRLSLEGVKVSG